MHDFETVFGQSGISPSIFFVCGCDGAGKRSLIRQAHATLAEMPCVDTEKIAQQSGQTGITAARISIAQANRLLAEGTSFVRVSTLSSHYDFRLASLARDAGFQTVLVYIGVTSADIAIKRVRHRGTQGGLDIAENIVRRHYERSMGNLQRGIQAFDRVVLLDNTSPEFKLFARFTQGQPEYYSFCPAWFRGVQKDKGYRFTGIYD